jgi:hypothetical protein
MIAVRKEVLRVFVCMDEDREEAAVGLYKGNKMEEARAHEAARCKQIRSGVTRERGGDR